MKLLTLLLSFPVAVLTAVTPRAEPFTEYLPLTFSFHGGPSIYTLDIRADGNTYNTSLSPLLPLPIPLPLFVNLI
jgi:hypothetical protein